MREFYGQSECRGRNIKLKPLVQNRSLAGWSTVVSWSCSGSTGGGTEDTVLAGLWDLCWSSSGHPQQHRWHSMSGWCSPEWVFATSLGKAAAKASTSSLCWLFTMNFATMIQQQDLSPTAPQSTAFVLSVNQQKALDETFHP